MVVGIVLLACMAGAGCAVAAWLAGCAWPLVLAAYAAGGAAGMTAATALVYVRNARPRPARVPAEPRGPADGPVGDGASG